MLGFCFVLQRASLRLDLSRTRKVRFDLLRTRKVRLDLSRTRNVRIVVYWAIYSIQKYIFNVIDIEMRKNVIIIKAPGNLHLNSSSDLAIKTRVCILGMREYSTYNKKVKKKIEGGFISAAEIWCGRLEIAATGGQA